MLSNICWQISAREEVQKLLKASHISSKDEVDPKLNEQVLSEKINLHVAQWIQVGKMIEVRDT